MIEVRHLTKEYRMGEETVTALKDISLKIKKGEICCIFGQSGSGKSTLLNMMAGMEKPTSGGIRIGGTIVTRLSEKQLADFRQKHTGFVFQSYNLMNSLNALENVALPLTFQGMERKKREKLAAQMLRQVGLGNRMKHFPGQMSGGQQQRVGIARAFISRPDVIFADEPTGNLDSKSRIEIMELMRRFARKYQLTIVLVSHDQEMASYADHMVTLLDGRIIEETWPDKSGENAGRQDQQN